MAPNRNAKASSSAVPYSPPATHIPRPANSWICFRTEQLALMQQNEPERVFRQNEVSGILSPRWHAMGPEDKKPYEEAAREAAREHALKYPGYKYQPLSKKEKERLASQKAAEGKAATPRRRTRRNASAPPYPTPTPTVAAPTVALHLPPPPSLNPQTFAPQLGQGGAFYPPPMAWHPQGIPIPHYGPAHWPFPPMPHTGAPMNSAMGAAGQHLPQVAPALPPLLPPYDIAPAPMFNYPGDLSVGFDSAGPFQQGGLMDDEALAAFSSLFHSQPTGPPSDASSGSSTGWVFPDPPF